MTTQSGVASRFRFWFDVVMIAVYLSAAIITLLVDQLYGLPSLNRYVIAATLFLYSGYRIYKAIAARRDTLKNEA